MKSNYAFAAIISILLAGLMLPARSEAYGDDRFEFTPCDPIPYQPYSRPDPERCAAWRAREEVRRQKESAADRKANPKYYRGLAIIRSHLASQGYDASSYSIIGTHVGFKGADFSCTITDVDSLAPGLSCYKKHFMTGPRSSD